MEGSSNTINKLCTPDRINIEGLSPLQSNSLLHCQPWQQRGWNSELLLPKKEKVIKNYVPPVPVSRDTRQQENLHVLMPESSMLTMLMKKRVIVSHPLDWDDWGEVKVELEGCQDTWGLHCGLLEVSQECTMARSQFTFSKENGWTRCWRSSPTQTILWFEGI